jgi:hypothetical protein
MLCEFETRCSQQCKLPLTQVDGVAYGLSIQTKAGLNFGQIEECENCLSPDAPGFPRSAPRW